MTSSRPHAVSRKRKATCVLWVQFSMCEQAPRVGKHAGPASGPLGSHDAGPEDTPSAHRLAERKKKEPSQCSRAWVERLRSGLSHVASERKRAHHKLHTSLCRGHTQLQDIKGARERPHMIMRKKTSFQCCCSDVGARAPLP